MSPYSYYLNYLWAFLLNREKLNNHTSLGRRLKKGFMASRKTDFQLPWTCISSSAPGFYLDPIVPKKQQRKQSETKAASLCPSLGHPGAMWTPPWGSTLNLGHGLAFYRQKIKQVEKPFHVGGEILIETQIAEVITKNIPQRGKLFSGAIFFPFITLPSKKIHRGKAMAEKKSKKTKFLLKVAS